MAEALEGAQSVDALSVPAHLALESAALIDVCEVNPAPNVSASPTRPKCSRQRAALTHAVVVVRQLEAREAEAVVGAHRVFAGAVTARLPVALVDV